MVEGFRLRVHRIIQPPRSRMALGAMFTNLVNAATMAISWRSACWCQCVCSPAMTPDMKGARRLPGMVRPRG